MPSVITRPDQTEFPDGRQVWDGTKWVTPAPIGYDHPMDHLSPFDPRYVSGGGHALARSRGRALVAVLVGIGLIIAGFIIYQQNATVGAYCAGINDLMNMFGSSATTMPWTDECNTASAWVVAAWAMMGGGGLTTIWGALHVFG
jgi:hypothetical protein